MEFKKFSEIENIGKMFMQITQKIHGSNAQILIYSKPDGTFDLICGKRTGWCTTDKDNFGFATFVHSHKQEFIDKLGEGRHFGEWAGPGINSGEGLKEKHFVLFDFWKYPPERPLPPNTLVVPVLYSGRFDLNAMETVMADLKANGSKLVPGYMHPEGVVITTLGQRLKKVFKAEETAWTKPKGVKDPNKHIPGPKVDHLLQPIRLEKLLSRDEVYLRTYPESLPIICKDYIADLEKEGQIVGTEDEQKAIRKALGKNLFAFIKQSILEIEPHIV